MYRAEERGQKVEIKLKTPEINKVEINEIPREVKLEIPIEQSESKLVQDVYLVSDMPTPFHAQSMSEISLPDSKIEIDGKKEQPMAQQDKITLTSVTKIHVRQRKVLG